MSRLKKRSAVQYCAGDELLTGRPRGASYMSPTGPYWADLHLPHRKSLEFKFWRACFICLFRKMRYGIHNALGKRAMMGLTPHHRPYYGQSRRPVSRLFAASSLVVCSHFRQRLVGTIFAFRRHNAVTHMLLFLSGHGMGARNHGVCAVRCRLRCGCRRGVGRICRNDGSDQ